MANFFSSNFLQRSLKVGREGERLNFSWLLRVGCCAGALLVLNLVQNAQKEKVERHSVERQS